MIALSRLSESKILNRLVYDPFMRLRLILCLAVASLLLNPFHPDFTGGQTIAAKYLAGERPYIDIIENNPPMTFYMHMPSAYLETLTGLRGEYWQYILALMLCLAVIGLGEWLRTGHAMPQDRDSAKRVGIFMLTLLVMPMSSFASRDQLTFVLIWPLLALYAEDAVKARTHPAWVYAGIGMLAGLGVCIKFYFFFGPVLACLYLCRIKRSVRPLFGIENISAVTVCLAYLASIRLWHPAYLDFIYPMLKYTYFAGHPSALYVVTNGLLIGTTFYLVMELAKDSPRLNDPRTKLLLMASLGFSICYFAFARNLPFRYLPPASCIFMALAAAQNHSQRSLPVKFYEVLFLVLCGWFMQITSPYRAEATQFVRSLKLDRPKILLLSRDLGDGQPLIRDVGGTLVNPGLHPWVVLGIDTALEAPHPYEMKLEFSRWIEWERNLTARAVERDPPDLIILEPYIRIHWFAWARMNVKLAGMLENYKKIGVANSRTFFIKKTPEELAEQTFKPSFID